LTPSLGSISIWTDDPELPQRRSKFFGKSVNGSRADSIISVTKSTSYSSFMWVATRIVSMNSVVTDGIRTSRKSNGRYHCRSVLWATLVPTYHSGESGTFL
jgi:hypothetical protein